MPSVTISGVALRSTKFFLKSHVAVGLGIAAATAVIVGALVVGDSVRGSLRAMVLDRLANIQAYLHARTFFDPQLLDGVKLPAQTNTELNSLQSTSSVLPMIYIPSATVEHRAEQLVHRGSQVQVFGVGAEFWSSIAAGEEVLPEGLQVDQVALGAALASELHAQVGDELTLRFHDPSGVPADNALGNRDDQTLSLPRQKIVAILDDRKLGGLSFHSTQTLPRNLYCSLGSLQDVLEIESRVNGALVLQTAHDAGLTPLDSAATEQLSLQLQPKLEDYGLQFAHVTRPFPDAELGEQVPGEQTAAGPAPLIYEYSQLTSQALLLSDDVTNAVMQEFDGNAQRVLTYLANTITKIEPLEVDIRASRMSIERFLNSDLILPNQSTTVEVQPLSRPVPYSTMAGVDGAFEAKLKEYTGIAPELLRSPYCWINAWLAQQLAVQAGDWVELKYYEPETLEGVQREQSIRCMVAGIVPLTEPLEPYRRNRPARYAQPPTLFNDPLLTPDVPGLTDKESISNWDAPFPLNLDLLEPVDDEYYENHRLTPKLYLPYRLASDFRLFGSRFGHATALRIETTASNTPAAVRSRIEKALLSTRAAQGFFFVPVRQQMLQSASGTTPFDMLFLSLSFFVIVAALLLVLLLFKLGITQRASQLGLLAAQGFTAARIRGLLLRELTLVAVGGAVAGIALGLLYAQAMIVALQTWWIGAISSPFLSFSFTWPSLLIGATVGVVMSLLTIYASLRKLSHVAPLQLLRGQVDAQPGSPVRNLGGGLLAVAGFLTVGAIIIIVTAVGQTGMARAGSFFGSGMLLLVAALTLVHHVLRSKMLGARQSIQANLMRLAWSAIYRNPLRSSLTLGLLAVASFLIASMSVFHVSPDPRGYGGYDLMGESSQPIFRNISSQAVREEALGGEASKLRDTFILPFRMRPGDDASCNNLFQVAQPTVLGVSPRMRLLNDLGNPSNSFQWAAATQPSNPWYSLENSGAGDKFSPIPVVLDQNTAAWSLKKGAALGEVFVLQYGPREVYFRTVGLLSGSILQGKLLVSDANFRYLFPEISGYSFFLIRSGDAVPVDEVVGALEQGWSTEGLDITSSAQTLASLLGVQNTYLSAFQSLGGLGLLLGTFGLIAVQLRSVLERRQELALMQAVGFSKSRIGSMLTLETVWLLGGGVLIGCLAAATALVPYVWENGTRLSALQPLLMLVLIMVVGVSASIIAVRSALKRNVLAGLR